MSFSITEPETTLSNTWTDPKHTDISLGEKINPEEEQEQTRCRICFESAQPLISVCGCSGSIAFVHETCILDWIATRIQSSTYLSIPHCEICHEQFSAKMQVNKQKICLQLLYEKVTDLSASEIVTAIVYALSIVLMILVMINFISQVISGELKTMEASQIIRYLFTNLAFPFLFWRSLVRYSSKISLLIEDSTVQIVEVTLTPKEQLKCQPVD